MHVVLTICIVCHGFKKTTVVFQATKLVSLLDLGYCCEMSRMLRAGIHYWTNSRANACARVR